MVSQVFPLDKDSEEFWEFPIPSSKGWILDGEWSSQFRITRTFWRSCSRTGYCQIRLGVERIPKRYWQSVFEVLRELRTYHAVLSVFDLDLFDLRSYSPILLRTLGTLTLHQRQRRELITYRTLSEWVFGTPKAARSIGRMMAYNPFCFLIPCHRVVHQNGSLGGYQGGQTLKRLLLQQEGLLSG